MSSPTFAETYNLVAFLEKPIGSNGFEQIIDFLNANLIKYALTVSPMIYTSCIKQFWTSAKVKTINDDVRLQALVERKKVIVNEASIRRDLRLDDAEGTFFSRVITPLFETIMVQAPKEVGDIPTDTQDIPILTQPSASQPQRKHKPRRKQKEATEVPQTGPQAKEHIPTPSHDPLPSGKDRLQLNELMDICTKLSDRVLSLEQTKTNQSAKIEKLKKRVKKLEEKKKKRTHGLKRLYKVGLSAKVESSEDEEGLGAQEDVSKQGKIVEIDANEDLFLIDETAQDQERIKDQDLFGVHDLDGDEVFMDVTTGENVEQDATITKSVKEIKAAKPKAKGVTIQEPSEFRTTSPPQPSQPPHAKDKGKGIMVEPEKPLKKKDQIALDKEATIDADRQLAKQIQSQEREQISIEERSKLLAELIESRRRCLEIVPEDDDDVAIEATPLSSKYPTIVDYKIYKEGKKSYFKIIRADVNSQNYLTFGTMFKNFNREDLEVLRSIVKERFKKIKPVDDIDNLLFQTLKTMFEHYVEDIIWKYQHGAVKVHNWKLYNSCGVYCVTTKNMV
nr:hypothetical protein [Tanacetum cinerariifolium]